jgi:hypothetical protein
MGPSPGIKIKYSHVKIKKMETVDKNKMRIVVCLTTIPSGYDGLKEVLNALLKQTRLPDRIYIHLPMIFKKTGEIYPKFEFDHKLVEIIRCDDKGSITKLYPVLQKETDPNTRVLLADDDNIPNSKMLETFEKYSKQHPDYALSTGGWIRGDFPFMFQPMFKNRDGVRKVDWIEGAGYILIPRKYLTDDLMNYKKYIPKNKPLRKLFKKHDDHWIAWHLRRNKAILATIPHNFFVKKASVKKTYNISKTKGFMQEVYTLSTYLKDKGIYKEPTSFQPIPLSLYFLIILVILIILILIFRQSRSSGHLKVTSFAKNL